jgi:hypothetical protein
VSQAQSNELQNQISVWRQKTQDGTMTTEDYKAAIAAIRGDRKSAHAASDQSRRTKAKAVIPDAKQLLGELGGLK